ncbi:hypothetical protein ZWY2020_051212 [Hordeum vulgare]|nr:hypothetical protein ZWY2020_051212 [Hordeum vulgare]
MRPFSQDSAHTQESSSKESVNHHEYNNEIPGLGVRGRADPGRRPRHGAAAGGGQGRVRRHPAGAGGPEAGAVHSGGEGPDLPSDRCCAAVKEIGERSPECLCAVLLSNIVRRVGVKPEVAITIPKRCDLADRPVGYKCGNYTMPSLQLKD